MSGVGKEFPRGGIFFSASGTEQLRLFNAQLTRSKSHIERTERKKKNS